MNELVKRILVAIPAAAFFIYMSWLGEWYFAITVILISFIVIQELQRILERSGLNPNILFPYSIGLWILLSPQLPYAFELGIIIFLLFLAVHVINSSSNSILELGSTLFAGIYGSIGFMCLLLIRNLYTGPEGFLLTLLLFFMVWGNDVFAYFGGKTFGKHKIAPELSPNKTWEGFFSGFIGSGIGLAAMFYLVPIESPLSLLMLAPLIILIGVFGPIGDFTESKLKRAAGVKDSSNILPGHGGFLDRFDALILAAPIMYAYLKFLEALGYVRF